MSCWAALADFSRIQSLDLPVPFCDGVLNFDATLQFVELENKLPGLEAYNNLVRQYHRKKFAEMTEGIERFRKEYETTPLLEPLEFLELQAKLEQLDPKESDAVKKFESDFRNAILLYPKSSLAPVLHASLASFYLANGSFPKALGIAQAAKEEYPFHDTACVHLQNVAEANYHLGNLDDANSGFQLLSQKCQNLKLLVNAKMRLIDISRQLGADSKEIETQYQKLTADYPSYVNRHHPEVSFNLGELSYRNKKYPASEFHFSEFQKASSRNHPCLVHGLKRLADLSLKTKKSDSVVLGNYLSVYERFPKTDTGRFSRIHAYSLEMPFISNAEISRRTQLIDSDLAQIQDRKIFKISQLEKSLGLLNGDVDSALDILNDLKARDEALISSEVSDFVRVSILKNITTESRKKESLKDVDKDESLLSPLEKSYVHWFKGTPDQEKVKKTYESLILERFKDNLQSNKLKRAIGKLERWGESPFFEEGKPSQSTQLELGSVLARWWLRQEPRKRKETAENFLSKEQELEKFLKPAAEFLWLEAYLDLDKKAELEQLLQKIFETRGVSSLLNRTTKKGDMDPLFVIVGKALRELKNYQKSQEYLSKVSDPDLVPIRNNEQVKVLNDMGKKRQAIEKGLKSLQKNKSPLNEEILDLCRRTVIDGKVWDLSKEVFSAAKSYSSGEPSLLPFYLMSGRALLEQGQYQKSVDSYRQVLKMSLEPGQKAESQFNLGRGLLNLKDIEGAKKEWGEVASLNDEFWSPLARNELKMLESK